MTPEAFLLLTLSHATLTTPTATQTGTLGLQCVTVGQDVYLVLRLESIEVPIDPRRTITLQLSADQSRLYTFNPTDVDPTQLLLKIAVPEDVQPYFLEDIETFEGILAQYADFQPASQTHRRSKSAETFETTKISPQDSGDLRGRLVLVNQDNGEVVGEFDEKLKVQEDPSLQAKGHEDDPVVIEIPSDAETLEGPREVFARTIPADEQDWITKSATVVSHAISSTTNLLLTVITSASSYYISHSSPSPHNPASPRSPKSPLSPPPPPPNRALVFLTSEQTRKGLATVHTFSGQAVKVSSKTLSLIDRMIERALGVKKGKSPATSDPPPPYSSTQYLTADSKPSLPPRRSPSPTTPLPPPTLPPRRLNTKARIVLSADLIFSTLDNSAKQLLNVGSSSISAMVAHKYGSEVAQSSQLMTGTAKNLGLVYIDMSGMGRKALVRRVGKTYIKSKMSSR